MRPCSQDQPQSRSALTFMVGLAVAALLTAVATITPAHGRWARRREQQPHPRAADRQPGRSPRVSPAFSCIGILRVARAWRAAATGARLHLRFVTLFSLAALAPAIIVAVFLGFTFTQGIERWFSQRVVNTIENAADVGRAYVDLASGGLGGEVQAMAEDLNVARRGLTTDPPRYAAFLQLQARAARTFICLRHRQRRRVLAGGALVENADRLSRAVSGSVRRRRSGRSVRALRSRQRSLARALSVVCLQQRLRVRVEAHRARPGGAAARSSRHRSSDYRSRARSAELAARACSGSPMSRTPCWCCWPRAGSA